MVLEFLMNPGDVFFYAANSFVLCVKRNQQTGKVCHVVSGNIRPIWSCLSFVVITVLSENGDLTAAWLGMHVLLGFIDHATNMWCSGI